MHEISVHLVRHGQSTWNVERRLQGQIPHPPLTAQGCADATAAAVLLARLTDGVSIYSSDLMRAAETADIIADRLGGLPVQLNAALREQHLGSMQGKLASELRPEPVPDGAHIAEVRWGGGESLHDVYLRLEAFFDEVLPTAPSNLIVVTHGDTLRVARALLTGRTHRDVEWDIVANGAVVTIPVRV